MAKGQMRGGFDPAEMGRRSWEKRRAKWEADQAKANLAGADDFDGDVRSLPRDRLIAVLRKPSTSDQNVINAAKALAALGDDETSDDWKLSVQVRPDYEVPTWPAVFAFARSIGAV